MLGRCIPGLGDGSRGLIRLFEVVLVLLLLIGLCHLHFFMGREQDGVREPEYVDLAT